jgi:biotin operon repressor
MSGSLMGMHMMRMGPMMGGWPGGPLPIWSIIGLGGGLAVVLCALLLHARPDRRLLGALIIVFSSLSIPASLGGFVAGFFLAVLGGILALTWKVAPPSTGRWVYAPPQPTLKEGETPTDALSAALTLMRPILSEDEQRVLEEIVKARGEILQRDLPKKLGFSKAAVSKVISTLERRGVVAREKYKWTYRVRLSERLISEAKNSYE